MGGIDKMIASSLSSEIKKELNSEILRKIERELFLEHGMSIKLSMEHFHNFLTVFKKNSSIDTDRFEKDCISKVLKVKIKDDKFSVTIIDQDLRDLILEVFGEIETRKIISTLLENEYTIPQILKESKIPKTSGYRKIENLIFSGLIIESGKILSESKKISKLQCIFEEINLKIKKDKIEIIVVVNKKIFEKSTSMKSIIKLQE